MKSRRRIYLLRHGDAAYLGSEDGDASDDPALTEQGVAEALALLGAEAPGARFLTGETFAHRERREQQSVTR